MSFARYCMPYNMSFARYNMPYNMSFARYNMPFVRYLSLLTHKRP